MEASQGIQLEGLREALVDDRIRLNLLLGKWLQFKRQGVTQREIIQAISADDSGNYVEVSFVEDGTPKRKQYYIDDLDFFDHVFASRDATVSLLQEVNRANQTAPKTKVEPPTTFQSGQIQSAQREVNSPTSFDSLENIAGRMAARSRRILSILGANFPELTSLFENYFNEAELLVTFLTSGNSLSKMQSQAFETCTTDASNRLTRALAKARITSAVNLSKLLSIRRIFNAQNDEMKVLFTIWVKND